MLKIKHLQRNQRFYAKNSKGEPVEFKVWMYPMQVNGKWIVDCTDDGDYCFTFKEEDESILFLTDKLED